MKAKINGFEVEGTPEEIKELIGASEPIKYVPVYPTYPTCPDTGTPYPRDTIITWC